MCINSYIIYTEQLPTGCKSMSTSNNTIRCGLCVCVHDVCVVCVCVCVGVMSVCMACVCVCVCVVLFIDRACSITLGNTTHYIHILHLIFV